MLIGHLLSCRGQGSPKTTFTSSLCGGSVPDVPALQSELDRLWACGYDPEGRQQLGGYVTGTQKWIGTSEACVLLRGQSVRCNIVAFRQGSAGDGSTAAAAAMEHAFRHFSGQSSKERWGLGVGQVTRVSRPPLYLQHSGHSRTVVGVQRRFDKSGQVDFLLVLDPGLGDRGFGDFLSASRRGTGWQKFVKRSIAPLQRKSEYEFLVIEEGAITPDQAVAARCIAQHI